MDIDVTTLTNADLMMLSQHISNERDARIADPSRIPGGNRPAPQNPMAPYDTRKRSLEYRVADVERRMDVMERRAGIVP